MKRNFRKKLFGINKSIFKKPSNIQYSFVYFYISQILSDPQKKEQYDNFGTVDGNQRETRDDSWTAHDFFREFRGPGGQYSFMFEDDPFSAFHSDSERKRNILNEYKYHNIVLPDSYHKPFLIYVLDEVCFDCMYIFNYL